MFRINTSIPFHTFLRKPAASVSFAGSSSVSPRFTGGSHYKLKLLVEAVFEAKRQSDDPAKALFGYSYSTEEDFKNACEGFLELEKAGCVQFCQLVEDNKSPSWLIVPTELGFHAYTSIWN